SGNKASNSVQLVEAKEEIAKLQKQLKRVIELAGQDKARADAAENRLDTKRATAPDVRRENIQLHTQVGELKREIIQLKGEINRIKENEKKVAVIERNVVPDLRRENFKLYSRVSELTNEIDLLRKENVKIKSDRKSNASTIKIASHSDL
ncbi:hypothetical protein PFISCL1PPCAC_6672, partial [Pristionchus fissidentatus]